ncbi:signal peptidase I [Rhodococcus sp. BP-241]|jgi:signal peptidase I|uniref:signal peptidase I n=1 Tax=unclassified Rhodococcus (in: high G+C Gram-positive bacteria) TaxID=192944 RepID=UPI001C9B09E0|nr:MULTISPECIES: signal peptidase I [unclassified Rhodococcus (in: high G+C Gram-positive bacteria)]MBY6676671.1 signal peptidase I [Rhodococcus sp. BP-332]MBY6706086.1 signal peptidase I [Rhodococcus sp. BP-241]
MSGHHRQPEKREHSVIRELALTVGAALGVLCMTAAVAAALFSITPLVFQSGSMSPAIDTGALALARTVPATDVRAGDIVTVEREDGSRLTHRVDDIQGSTSDSVTMILKGDANDFPDSNPYTVTEVDRVFAHVGTLGWAVAWLSSPTAIVAGGLLVGLLVLIAWKPSATAPAQTASPSSGSATVMVSVFTVALLALSVTGAPAAHAALAPDSGTAVSGTLTTRAGVAAPGSLACANKQGGALNLISMVTLSWAPSGTGATYTYVLRKSGSADIAKSASPTTTASGRVSFDLDNGALINLAPLTGVYTVFVTATIGGVTSAPSNSLTVTMNPGLAGIAASARCGGTAAQSARVAAPPATSTESINPSATPTSTAPTVTTSAATTTTPSVTSAAPTTTSTATTTTTATPTTTSAPAAPVDLVGPRTSPSGAFTARVLEDTSGAVLTVSDSTGSTLHRGQAPPSSGGYLVVWADDDSLWFRDSAGLRRLAADNSWSAMTVPDDDASVPAEVRSVLG